MDAIEHLNKGQIAGYYWELSRTANRMKSANIYCVARIVVILPLPAFKDFQIALTTESRISRRLSRDEPVTGITSSSSNMAGWLGAGRLWFFY